MSDGDAIRLEEYQRQKHAEEGPEPEGAAAPRRIKSVWSGAITLDERAEWQIKRIIPAGGLVEIYGVPGCGKSFLAIHLAMAVAVEPGRYAGKDDQYPLPEQQGAFESAP